MVGVELYDPTTGQPATGRVAALQAHCRESGRLLLMNAGTYGNVLRWMPPLVVTADEISIALAAFEAALDATL